MQVKSMMLTDAGFDEPLCPYHSWNTTTSFQ